MVVAGRLMNTVLIKSPSKTGFGGGRGEFSAAKYRDAFIGYKNI